MIRSTICLVAQGIIRDAATNNISIYNIIEGLTAEGFPLFIQQLGFFALLEKTTEDSNIAPGHFVAALDSQTLYEQDIELNFAGGLRNRVLIGLQGVVIPRPGQLTFTLSTPSQTLASYSVQANAVAGAQAEVTPSPQA